MPILRIKVLTCESEHELSYLAPFYLDVDTITGFYIPVKQKEDEHIEGEFISIFHGGCWTLVSQENHLVQYLSEKFVNNSITK